ncbi:MAG TPA: hypothetical protein VGM62_19375 [Chthoniobacterales bacterium]|jgi:hypothetical protein
MTTRRISSPLRVLQSNPRYFTDDGEQPIYLTGSHNWNNFYQASDVAGLDFQSHLRFLGEQNHNFTRLWVAEQATWTAWNTEPVRFEPTLYQRTGPGNTPDGALRFDLSRLNDSYFQQLRQRVMDARDAGIYVAVMLFNGWSVGKQPYYPGNPWPGHPFNRHNNVNGIDGDLDGDGEGKDVHTLQCPAVTRLQEAYVGKVIDTLNDLHNVLWEISNESVPESREWQYHMVRFIKRCEAPKPFQHPVGITGMHPDGRNADLFQSPADWVSPNRDTDDHYRTSPPPSDGTKVILTDTDHLWGIGGDRAWVWKSFLRGLNPIYMDPLQDQRWTSLTDQTESCRRAMGETLNYAGKINLAAMTPRPDLASTGYCLANPGEEYLVYLPFEPHRLESARFFRKFKTAIKAIRTLFKRKTTVDLSATAGESLIEWCNPATGDVVNAPPRNGGAIHRFKAPFRGDAVLLIRNQLVDGEQAATTEFRGAETSAAEMALPV